MEIVMTQPEDSEYLAKKQTSESLENCIALVRHTLLRHHSADYIEKNPIIFAACIQACAIDSAARNVTRKLEEIADLLKEQK